MNRNLVAPRYAPAAAYHAPAPAPFDLNVDTVSIGELMSAPATSDLVKKYTPWAAAMYGSEMFKPHRSNFTLRDMATFIPGLPANVLSPIDAALRQLPQSEWPDNVR